MKKLLILSLIFVVTACGFQPLHSREFRARQDADLTSIRIETNNTRLGQLLKAEIEDGVNPDYANAEKLYTLTIALNESEIYLFVNPDGTSSRGDIQYNSQYTLTRSLDGKVVQRGDIIRVSSYNISEQADYASYVSEEDARKRGIVELAQDYKLRLSNLLVTLNPSTIE
jgi:hypothetical protein